MLDMADWANEFGEFGEPHQLPWLPPIELTQQQHPSMTFGTLLELPRLLIRPTGGGKAVQLQNDRFAFGWTRSAPIGELEAYPGYDTLKDEQIRNASKFRQWSMNRFGLSPKTRLVELLYNNGDPIVLNGIRRRLSEIFRWVQPGRPVNGFQVSWTELLELGRSDAPRVNAVVALGPALPVSEALLFNFSGFAPIENPSDSATYSCFDALHERILAMYEAAIVAGGRS